MKKYTETDDKRSQTKIRHHVFLNPFMMEINYYYHHSSYYRIHFYINMLSIN